MFKHFVIPLLTNQCLPPHLTYSWKQAWPDRECSSSTYLWTGFTVCVGWNVISLQLPSLSIVPAHKRHSVSLLPELFSRGSDHGWIINWFGWSCDHCLSVMLDCKLPEQRGCIYFIYSWFPAPSFRLSLSRCPINTWNINEQMFHVCHLNN